MKAIIPVAGAGTKLRPHTYTQPKALIPMAGKTILSVIVDELIANNVDEFVFVIGYLGDKIKDYITIRYPNLKCNFVLQNERQGTGHAIWLTKEVVGNEQVLIVFGDTICDYNIKEVIAAKVSQIGVRKVDDPRTFGVAELDNNDNVLKVLEKPLIPKSNMAIVGVYKIIETDVMYNALDNYIKNESGIQGEYHFTYALQQMIENGVQFKAFRVNNWFDCGKKETLLETNQTLLKSMLQDETATAFDNYENTVIIPPVHIAPGCQIKDSIIGPSVSIGENSKIITSIINNSIIGSYTQIEDIVLKESIIGSDAYVRGSIQSLNIGDNTEIDLR